MSAPLLELAHVAMPDVGVHDCSFAIPPGGIHAVVSGPHAGRSPLAELLSGSARHAFTGDLLMDGASKRFRNVRESLRAGIAVIHPAGGIVARLSVLENIVLGREPGRAGFLSAQQARLEAERVYGMLETEAPLGKSLESLGSEERLLIQLARALLSGPRLLVLDQWAELLSEEDAVRFRRRIAALSSPDRSLLLLTHRVEEVFHIADRITVIHRGRTVATHLTAEVDEETLLLEASGRSESSAPPAEKLFQALRISPREQEIVRLLVKGHSTTEIGELLDIAANTVKAHLFSIYRKTGVKNRLELAHLVRHGPEKPVPLP